MKEKHCLPFWWGFLSAIGLVLATAVAFWYWQKSTSADEGALDLLDELAKVQRQVAELRQKQVHGKTAVVSSTTSPATASTATQAADDLTRIHGIGPIYARRLREAGIFTFAALAEQEPEQVRQIAKIQPWQVADPVAWIAEAALLKGAH